MNYYVTVTRDHSHCGVLLGPFSTADVAAAWVPAAMAYVRDRYPSHAFDVFGVARSTMRRTGRLSREFGYAHH